MCLCGKTNKKYKANYRSAEFPNCDVILKKNYSETTFFYDQQKENLRYLKHEILEKK